jgi:hypothetical protein
MEPTEPNGERPGAAKRWGLLILVLALVAACVILVDSVMRWLLGR